LVGNIARVGLGVASGCGNLLRRSVGRFFVEIENPHRSALLHETLRDGAADATAGTGNDGDFASRRNASRCGEAALRATLLASRE